MVNVADFKVQSQCCCLSVGVGHGDPGTSQGTSVGRIKMTSSAADLGQNSGIQGAPTSGQCSRETAVPRSSSSAQHSRAGE